MTTKPFEFDKALKELEDITAWFESSDVDLDQGLAKFERGMELSAQLKEHLAGVENRVEKIKARFAPGATPAPPADPGNAPAGASDEPARASNASTPATANNAPANTGGTGTSATADPTRAVGSLSGENDGQAGALTDNRPDAVADGQFGALADNPTAAPTPSDDQTGLF